jgi:hypothetical protein
VGCEQAAKTWRAAEAGRDEAVFGWRKNKRGHRFARELTTGGGELKFHGLLFYDFSAPFWA